VLTIAILPQVFFLLAGGVVADRFPRHLLMVGSNVAAGIAQAVAAYLLLTGRAEIWQLAVIALVRAVASSFFFPAQQGIVPQTVSAEQLQPANALLRLALNTTNIGGRRARRPARRSRGAGLGDRLRRAHVPRQRSDPAADARPCARA
jgi:MFS family permease